MINVTGAVSVEKQRWESQQREVPISHRKREGWLALPNHDVLLCYATPHSTPRHSVPNQLSSHSCGRHHSLVCWAQLLCPWKQVKPDFLFQQCVKTLTARVWPSMPNFLFFSLSFMQEKKTLFTEMCEESFLYEIFFDFAKLKF